MDKTSAKSEAKALSRQERERKYRNEYFKKRYHSDPEFKARLISHIRKSREKKKDYYNAKQREQRAKDPEKHREYMRKWREKNRESIREYQRNYMPGYLKKKEIDKKRKKEKV